LTNFFWFESIFGHRSVHLHSISWSMWKSVKLRVLFTTRMLIV